MTYVRTWGYIPYEDVIQKQTNVSRSQEETRAGMFATRVISYLERALHEAEQVVMENGGRGKETEGGNVNQRVSCPSCGRILFSIESVRKPADASFSLRTKCKAGGCHKFCLVTYDEGKLIVALL